MAIKNQKKADSNIILNINGETCHDQKTIADHFNHLLTTVASSLIEKLPPASKLFDYNSTVYKDFYKFTVPNHNKFKFKHVTEDFVFKELVHLNASKSTYWMEFPPIF